MSTRLGRAPAWVDNFLRRGVGGSPPLVRPPALAFQPLVPAMAPMPRDRVLVVTRPGAQPAVVSRMGRAVITEAEASAAAAEIAKAYPGATIKVITGVEAGPGGSIAVDGRPAMKDLRLMVWP